MRSRRTPYTRPAPQKPGIWSRVKNFFWGQTEPTQLGPPQLLSWDESESSRITNPEPFEEEAPSIVERSASGFVPFEESVFAEFPSGIGAPLERAEAAMSQPAPGSSTAPGPNEALEQFFAEKGDAELSNVEIVGALSLIGQAVSRNESLLDFSNLSESSRASVEPSEVSDVSVLRHVNAPSPRHYLRGTPPPARRASRSSLRNSTSFRPNRSPWTSPRPYLSAQPGLRATWDTNTARRPVQSPYRRTNKLPLRSSLAADRDSARNSIRGTTRDIVAEPAREPASSSGGPSREESTAVLALRRALDNPSPKPERFNRRIRYVRESEQPENSSLSLEKSTEQDGHLRDKPGPTFTFGSAAPTSFSFSNKPADTPKETMPTEPEADPKPAFTVAKTVEPVKPVEATKPVEVTKPAESVKPAEPAAVPAKPAFEFKPTVESPKPSAAVKPSFSDNPTEPAKPLSPKPAIFQMSNGLPKESKPSDAEYEFEIPVSRTPREMTPAEEAIVAKSQNEFQF